MEGVHFVFSSVFLRFSVRGHVSNFQPYEASSCIANWGFWDILFLKHTQKNTKTQKPTFKKDKNFKFKK